MRYMLLIAVNPQAYAGMSQEAQQQLFKDYYAFTEEIRGSGEYVSGDPLQGAETATTVRLRDGRRHTTDGPFAESKEVLAGYYVVDVSSLDRALELAAKIPDAVSGAVEVRPVLDMDMTPPA
jgi:hypothetical protein